MSFEELDQTEQTDRNPRMLIRAIEELNRKEGVNHFPEIYITCGAQDELIGANQQLAEALAQAGASVIYQPRPGRHDAHFCNDSLPDVISWLNLQTKER